MDQQTIQPAAEAAALSKETLGVQLDDLLAADREPSSGEGREVNRQPFSAGVVIGNLIEIAGGWPMVDFVGNPTGNPLAARSMVALADDDRGREVVLMFESGDPCKPVVLGLVQPTTAARPSAVVAGPAASGARLTAELDGEEVILTARERMVLRCGKASITLTRAGKVLIRGAYLLSRSSGVNRVKGGSVQIN